jgi:pimeloyl-ACP methyl ester carboxylesterase
LNNSSNLAEGGPLFVISDLERRARRFETKCGDGALVWRAWGHGPPLLLLHGAQGAWSHWIRNIDALSQGHTLWVPDIPGYGESANPPIEEQGEIASALAEGLCTLIPGPFTVDLVGFSFGSTTGAALAAACPSLVRRLVLVDAGGLNTPLGEFALQRVRGLKGAERRAAHRANLLNLMLHDPANVDELAIHLQETNVSRARLNPEPLLMPDKLLQILPNLSASVSAIWGECDRPHPPFAQEAVLRAIFPSIVFRVIADAGHWVMYEQPKAFNEALLELLALPAKIAP